MNALRFTYRSTSVTLATVLLAATACDAPTASRADAPFDVTALSQGLHYRWANGSHVRVAVITTNLPTTTDLVGATKRAIDAWNAVPQFAEFTLELVSTASDANVIVFDQVTTLPVVPAACAFQPSGASGYTYFCSSHQASRTTPVAPDSALKMNLITGNAKASVVIRVDRGRAASAAVYDAIVAHELGHALGIGGHSSTTTDVMYGAPTVATPSTNDKAALRSALGAAIDIRL